MTKYKMYHKIYDDIEIELSADNLKDALVEALDITDHYIIDSDVEWDGMWRPDCSQECHQCEFSPEYKWNPYTHSCNRINTETR